MLTGQRRGNDFFCQGRLLPSLSLPSPPFLSFPVFLPFLSSPLEVQAFPPPLPSLPFTCKLPTSKTITTTTLWHFCQGSEMVVCKMRLRVKNALLHKMGLCNLPTFILPVMHHSFALVSLHCIYRHHHHHHFDYCMLVLCMIMVSVRPKTRQDVVALSPDFPSTVPIPLALSTAVPGRVLGQERHATPELQSLNVTCNLCN